MNVLNRTVVAASPEPRHILHLKVNSATVEGLVSVIFDLLILATAEMLIHNICSSHNLRTVYDNCAALYLRSPSRSFLKHLLPDVAVGPSWLSRGLSVLLVILSTAAVLLGFSINGVSENGFTPSTLRTVATIPYPPKPVRFDYKNEYRLARGQTGKDRPRRLSQRLVALTIVDQCQICYYDKCEYTAYAFSEDRINNKLFDADKERKRLPVECVTKATFRENIVNWRTNRTLKSPRKPCPLKRVVVGSIQDDTPSDGTPEVGDCKLDIMQTRCYRRRGAPVHCAIVAKQDDADRLVVISVKDATAANNSANVDASYFAMTSVMKLSNATIRQHLDNLAFLSSLNINAGTYKLDLMAFVHLSHDVVLNRRDKKEEINVSEVDLRIAAPCIVVLLFSLVLLAVAAGHAWAVAVYYKRRHNFNSFNTVPDILELLLESGAHINRSRQEASFSPVVGLRRDSPRLAVTAPGEEKIGGSKIQEDEIL